MPATEAVAAIAGTAVGQPDRSPSSAGKKRKSRAYSGRCEANLLVLEAGQELAERW